MINRRQALKALTLATATVSARALRAQNPPPAPVVAPPGPFKLPPLPYAFDALEPYIDARTMEIHHDKHHAAYVANLNKAAAQAPAIATKTPEELVRQLATVPEAVRTAVRNNAGGDVNHTFFWLLLKKNAGGKPSGALAAAIDKQFGSFANFQAEFGKAAMSVFGSGWAWLTLDGKTLKIETTPNQDSPLTAGRVPLLAIDIWEHAYYLKYQNRRVEYVQAFWNVINWPFVQAQYQKAIG